MHNTLCFVLMPFGKKPDPSGREIDFDAVYRDVIQPAIAAAGLEPIRADEEKSGGIIHKPMFERLALCAYAVADLTLANGNVLYELGIRHAVRPWRTITLFAEGNRLPFDVNYLRSIPYRLDATGVPRDAAADRATLSQRLGEARREVDPGVDSPFFQLLDYVPPPQIGHAKTDLFREQVRYSDEAKRAFGEARKKGTGAAVQAVLQDLKPVNELEAGILVDAMLSFRAVKAWKEMIAFIERLPRELRETVMFQEQLGFALNRDGRGDDAERVLVDLLRSRGPSPETLGILGRVYKDRWEKALSHGGEDEAHAYLEKAVDTYLKGFESDFRDAYPGVNALTLMELRAPPDPRRERLAPIVRYAVERKMAAKPSDYWDHATVLELAVLRRDEEEGRAALGRALAAVRESERWEPETTARNLALIRRARQRRGEPLEWANDAERKLRAKAGLETELT